jgi:hypothetical protein
VTDLQATLRNLASKRYTLRQHQVADRPATPAMAEDVTAPTTWNLRVTVKELTADAATVDSSCLTPQVRSRLVQLVPVPERSFAAQRLAQLVEG